MKILVQSTVGENCISLDDGQKIYEVVSKRLDAKEVVELDFTGVRIFASPFFNAAIGQLLRDFEPLQLNTYLSISGLPPAGVETVRKVIENSREYYSSAKRRRAIEKAAIPENQK